MPRQEYKDHLFSKDEIIVSKNDGSREMIFTSREDADDYYDVLRHEELQEEASRAQIKTVEQNKQILENQQKLIEAQKQNTHIPQSPTFPQPTRQILDSEYMEWLQYKKETDPLFVQWKNKKLEKQRRIEQQLREDSIKRNYERQRELERLRREEERQKKEEERQIQEKCKELDDKLLGHIRITKNDKKYIATNTSNQAVIKYLREKSASNLEILSCLYLNHNLTEKDRNNIGKRIEILYENKRVQEEMEEAEKVADAKTISHAWIIISIIAAIIIITFVASVR